MSIQFTDVCFITEDVLRLRDDFYEKLFSCNAEGDETHSFVHAPELGICEPTMPILWPWGAKSFSLCDPDGNNIVIRSWSKED